MAEKEGQLALDEAVTDALSVGVGDTVELDVSVCTGDEEEVPEGRVERLRDAVVVWVPLLVKLSWLAVTVMLTVA